MRATLSAMAICIAAASPLTASATDFTLAGELQASDGIAEDLFGADVAVSGNLAFVGAAGQDFVDTQAGAVYVFELRAGSAPVEVARLIVSDGGRSDRFGSAVAVDGDVVVVGAPFADGFSRGAAYIFEKPAGGWQGTILESATLIPTGRGSNDRVGIDVAIDGDTVAIGANGDDDTAGQEGAIYIFEKPVGGWVGLPTESAKLVPAPRAGANSGETGTTVAIDGGVVVSGSRSQTQGDDTRQGRGLVFLEPPGGWTGVLNESAVLIASDGQSGDRLGRGVAVEGGIIAVGATAWDIGAPNTNNGAVYVFEEPPGGWSGEVMESAIPTSSEPFSNEALGIEVGIEGSTITAGTDYDGSAGGTRESIYVFRRPQGGWVGSITETQRLEDAVTGEKGYGNVVSIGSGRIITGARGDDLVATNAGRAYVYLLDGMFEDSFESRP